MNSENRMQMFSLELGRIWNQRSTEARDIMAELVGLAASPTDKTEAKTDGRLKTIAGWGGIKASTPETQSDAEKHQCRQVMAGG